MFGLGRREARQEKPGRKVLVQSREAWLDSQLAKLQERYNDLQGRYATLYELNQMQARKIDELTGANLMLGGK